jgi:glycerol uptake facilitator-like aquaporin
MSLARRMLAETLGTGMLVVVVVGSGIAAQRLSPGQVGLQLLENSTATALGLAVLILLFGPVSGAHLNPVVSAAHWWLGRRAGTGLHLPEVAAYTAAQVLGAIGGAALANTMYSLPAIQVSTHHRATGGVLLGEVVATAGLLALIFALTRSGRAGLSATAVGAYIGAAYWFTSSTSFANPAVTIGRIFSDTFAGIAPTSVGPFIAAQILGAGLGAGIVHALYPDPADSTDPAVVVARPSTSRADAPTERGPREPVRPLPGLRRPGQAGEPGTGCTPTGQPDQHTPPAGSRQRRATHTRHPDHQGGRPE